MSGVPKKKIVVEIENDNEKTEKVEKKESKKGYNVKKRNWAFVLYPESAPDDWREQLQKSGLQVAVSPLHDKDIDPNGEPKKAHYHIILIYSGPTSYSVVNALCSSLNQPIPKPLESVRGYFRYFTHKDNPDKFQYNDDDITYINGFNILDFVELTKSEVNMYKRKIQQIIRDGDITEYCELMDILLDSDGYSNEYDVASSHTLFFNNYLCSRRNKLKLKKKGENVET